MPESGCQEGRSARFQKDRECPERDGKHIAISRGPKKPESDVGGLDKKNVTGGYKANRKANEW